mmetsp:Transcript_7082/g.24367  ORF Transcript_7082/g.24367 Transcript_7082/m.24367 type:complete len:86 (+) Transcript_7082:1207-1464(+)
MCALVMLFTSSRLPQQPAPGKSVLRFSSKIANPMPIEQKRSGPLATLQDRKSTLLFCDLPILSADQILWPRISEKLGRWSCAVVC